MAQLIEVSPPLWLEHYSVSEAARFGDKPTLHSNLFYSIQLMGIDICDKNLKAWALVVDQEQVGWIAACFNSQKCIRIRGIIIRKDKRNLGYGQQMISKLILTYEKKPEFILFCTEAMISYYEKFGFKKVDDFIPRPVEVYDASTKEYSVRCLEKLCLMRFLNKS